jgi:hypothetical protein
LAGQKARAFSAALLYYPTRDVDIHDAAHREPRIAHRDA